MARFVLAAVAVLALADAAPVRAQFNCGFVPTYGYSYSYRYQRGFALGVGGGGVRVAGFAGGFVTRSYFVAPPLYVGPYLAPPGAFSPFLNPFYNPFAPVVVAPVPVPVPVVVAGGIVPADADAALLPRGARAGEFLVIAPRAEADPRAVVRPRPPGPVLAFDPFRPLAAVTAEAVEADPKREAVRLLALGRAAFAAGDFGRADEHFARATAADAARAEAHFLRAQALFAAGKYADAVAALRAGLALDAKWPEAPFDPGALYGPRRDQFDGHLAALRKALADNPGVPALEFLLGYQLWFTGAKPEADALFRAAGKRLADPGPLALFKLP